MNDLSYLLIKASRQLKNKLDKALIEYNITAAQFSVIMQIQASDKMITSAEIAQLLGSDRPTISGIINRLEKKAIVYRVDNPGDKRSSYLKIDKGANELVNRLIIISEELSSKIFSIYSEKERKILMEMICRLLEEDGE